MRQWRSPDEPDAGAARQVREQTTRGWRDLEERATGALLSWGLKDDALAGEMSRLPCGGGGWYDVHSPGRTGQEGDHVTQPEAWLRGPVSGVPEALQPVAHALLQALDDAERLTAGLDTAGLWTSLGGTATIGFHLRHMAGSVDRLLTYARGESLSAAQRAALVEEQTRTQDVAAEALLRHLRETIDRALTQLRSTSDECLDDHRPVGRAGLPSTVRGLLHHAGEHAARHAGQISTAVRILQGLRREDALRHGDRGGDAGPSE